MVNPNLLKKLENTKEANDNTKRLFQLIYREQKQDQNEDDDIPKIRVSEIISKMSFYYEKIRNTVDYKEEYLLRKNAVERILKRQIVIHGALASKEISNEEIAKHLITELIRAGYLPNNQIPEDKINEIAPVIGKYVNLKNKFLEYCKKDDNSDNEKLMKEKNQIVNWIIGVAASDLEERLSPNKVAKHVVKSMFETLSAKIKLPKDSPYEKDKDIQIFISIHRNYLKFDEGMLGFILLKYYNSTWNEADQAAIEKIARNIQKLSLAVEYQLNHPLTKQIDRIVSRYNVFYSFLVDVIAENPVLVYDNLKNDPKAFPRDIKKICEKRYSQATSKLWRAAVRSIIYIFLTKSVFAVALEVPAIKLFGEQLNMVALGINISFPAMLLFLVVLFTKMPSDENTTKIITGIEEIIYKKPEEMESITLREPLPRSFSMNFVFSFLYTITFFFSIGFIVWALSKVGFNWVSITIFLFFLAFVSFFSVRIRKGAKELIIVTPKERLWNLMLDFFYVPIIASGKWMSERFSRINVFVFILDFIIEAPFKVFVEIAEDWTKYVRERKEDLE